ESWMLGRFIIPAARLAELGPYVKELFTSEDPLRLSLVGRGGQRPEAFLAGLRAGLHDSTPLHEVLGRPASLEAIEIRLPLDPAAAVERNLIGEAWKLLTGLVQPAPEMFLEIGPGSDWRSDQEAAIAGIARFNQAVRPGSRNDPAGCGFKLRCAGTEATAVPGPEQVVGAVFSCVAGQVPFKATAGLHHPLRRFDPTLRVATHGFLSLFAMGTLAWARQLDKDRATQML